MSKGNTFKPDDAHIFLCEVIRETMVGKKVSSNPTASWFLLKPDGQVGFFDVPLGAWDSMTERVSMMGAILGVLKEDIVACAALLTAEGEIDEQKHAGGLFIESKNADSGENVVLVLEVKKGVVGKLVYGGNSAKVGVNGGGVDPADAFLLDYKQSFSGVYTDAALKESVAKVKKEGSSLNAWRLLTGSMIEWQDTGYKISPTVRH